MNSFSYRQLLDKYNVKKIDADKWVNENKDKIHPNWIGGCNGLAVLIECPENRYGEISTVEEYKIYNKKICEIPFVSKNDKLYLKTQILKNGDNIYGIGIRILDRDGKEITHGLVKKAKLYFNDTLYTKTNVIDDISNLFPSVTYENPMCLTIMAYTSLSVEIILSDDIFDYKDCTIILYAKYVFNDSLLRSEVYRSKIISSDYTITSGIAIKNQTLDDVDKDKMTKLFEDKLGKNDDKVQYKLIVSNKARVDYFVKPLHSHLKTTKIRLLDEYGDELYFDDYFKIFGTDKIYNHPNGYNNNFCNLLSHTKVIYEGNNISYETKYPITKKLFIIIDQTYSKHEPIDVTYIF